MAIQREEATPIPQPAYPAEPYYHREDEISLVDLWLVLVKRKRLIGAVLAAGVLAGIAAALLLPKKYTYSTTIEIGAMVEDKKSGPIEAPETSLAKLKGAYIPLVLQEHASSHPQDETKYQIAAKIPKKSRLLTLESKGTEAQGEDYLRVQQAIVTHLQSDHQRVIDILRTELQIGLSRLQHSIEGLKDQAKVLQMDLKRQDVTAALLTGQIAETKQLIATAEENRPEAVTGAKGTADAMTLLLIDNEIQQNRERLATLEERLHIELPRERDKLAKAIADNRRAQAKAQSDIEEANLRLANIRETRAVVAPMRSLRPTGPNRRLIVTLATVLGLMSAVFAAFVAEFLSKAREKIRSAESDTGK